MRSLRSTARSSSPMVSSAPGFSDGTSFTLGWRWPIGAPEANLSSGGCNEAIGSVLEKLGGLAVPMVCASAARVLSKAM